MKLIQFIIKILPKRIKYFVVIDVIVKVTTGKYGNTEVPKLTAMEAIRRYEKEI